MIQRSWSFLCKKTETGPELALLSGWSNMEMGFNNLRMLLLRDVSTLKVVRHRTQSLSQSKLFWSLLWNDSCCCTPNKRGRRMGFNNLRMQDVSTLKVVHHKTQLLSQSKYFWSLLSNKSCCCTPNNREMKLLLLQASEKRALQNTNSYQF